SLSSLSSLHGPCCTADRLSRPSDPHQNKKPRPSCARLRAFGTAALLRGPSMGPGGLFGRAIGYSNSVPVREEALISRDFNDLADDLESAGQRQDDRAGGNAPKFVHCIIIMQKISALETAHGEAGQIMLDFARIEVRTGKLVSLGGLGSGSLPKS